jgi:mono/diheme cytochrome c family protein
MHEPPVVPEPPGGGPVAVDCDPTVVYFQQQVLPIFIAHCTDCHSGDDPPRDIDLTSYAHVMDDDLDIVRPYDLNRKLFRAITDDDPDDRMPLGRPALSQEEIDLVAAWIMQGAQNTSCEGLACDTLDVTWTGNILPLIQSRCIGCHAGSNSSSGLDLTNWNVANGLASNGQLAGAIQHWPSFAPMPPAGPMLSECEIRRFLIWIDNGAPQ